MKFEYDKKLRELEKEAFALAIKNGYDSYEQFWNVAEHSGHWTEDMSKIHSLYRHIGLLKSLGKG